ncbi:NAD(P)-dependent oxidoreductase [Streptomyces griseoviridis]|uniref:NAD-dependent epimerase/dehydratase family protein n=1 Tax=Streptomyces griseoviridis TaxID=45398 RepID=UPI003406D723
MSGPTASGAVAVLGGTGCVGRHVCAAFAARGRRVVAVARRPSPAVGAHRFVPLDAAGCTPGELAAVLAAEGVGTVVNATLGWGRTEAEMGRTNVGLVERLLDALRGLDDPPRLVQLGTIHEYGPVPHGTPLDERVPPRPQTLYARAKLTASRSVLAAVGAEGLDAVVLRLTNTIGPYPAPDSLFGSLAARLRDDTEGAGVEVALADARRDYVDVRDASWAVVLAAESTAGDPLLNIGSGAARHLSELVDALVRAGGLTPDAIRRRQGDAAGRSAGADWIQVDHTRARRLLGWRPRHDVDTSMRDLWSTVRAAVPDPAPSSGGDGRRG